MTGAAGGRPLRFLLVLLLIWSGGRVAMHLPVPSSLPPPELVPSAAAEQPVRRRSASARRTPVEARVPAAPAWAAATQPSVAPAVMAVRQRPAGRLERMAAAVPVVQQANEAGDRPSASEPPLPSPAPPPALSPAAGRWALSAWLFWRDGGGRSSLASVGQLGGSQAGARVDFDLTPGASSRLTAYARATTALARPHAPEAAAGLSLQPSRNIPVSLAAERRLSLGAGGRDAFALLAVAGIGPREIAPDISIEGYGQAGMVGLKRRDLFADGRLSLLRAVAPLPVSAGVGLSGGAQPGIRRLDVGPQVQARFRAGAQSFRLTAEWRERIAGNAAPGSGPALTLAADF